MTPITVTVSNASGGAQYSNMVRFDEWAGDAISIQCVVTGTVNYTIQTSLDDPNSATNPVAVASMTWFNTNDTTVVNATSSQQSNFGFIPVFARVVLNSGSGSVTTTFLQAGGVTL